MNRVDVLMEAMPYIQQFHGKTVVVKLGGHAMVDAGVLDTVIQDVVLLHYVGMRVVIVHGGGPEITQKMKDMGKEPKFVAGLRITDKETLEIAQMVLVGKINDGIVSLITKFGARGVGVSGNDGNILFAKKMGAKRIKIDDLEQDVDLGHVGEIEEVDPSLLECLLENKYIPVIAPIAIDKRGMSLNVNADTAAGEIAVALKAFKFINMSDVDGVMNAQRTRTYHRLNINEAERLIEEGVIVSGMIPKIESCISCLKNGVDYTHIINGNNDHSLLLELFTHEGVGTMITRNEQ
ncbi:acetylglutamate kinase [Methanoplanus limicola]|uniref:Acetylglutamate kinase n=1 Tax=Methanoplanus limicola DSM 2279 TaxID=937775 RepID=H1YYY8_9EURY|nr:acetylglutamate kinase [Methanoplanus limicola]EHQ37060.1 N-acetylglutamate kinase [Methanoplanus limicola DSM 2279]